MTAPDHAGPLGSRPGQEGSDGRRRGDDLSLPFQIDRYGLRGRLVRLGPVVETVLDRHAYPEPVAVLLGQALALAACLAATIKYEGVFTLQARGAGPMRMLVADVTSAGAMRGYAGFDAEALAALLAQEPAPTVPRLFGGGHLAFTVDRAGGEERYQGIVALDGATLAECVHHYFRQSEQIDTGMKLACGRRDGRWRAAALMVQRLPEQRDAGDDPDDAWHRALVLLGTAENTEMLDPALDPDALLFRLFHEDGVRVWDRQPLQFGCRCSRGRVERVLRSLPRHEIEDLKIDDQVHVTCEFCNSTESFDQADLDRIYATASG